MYVECRDRRGLEHRTHRSLQQPRAVLRWNQYIQLQASPFPQGKTRPQPFSVQPRYRFRGLVLAQLALVSAGRATTCHYCPCWLSVLWLAVGFMALLLSTGCRRALPVVDTAQPPHAAHATIPGTARGPEGTSPVPGRTVEIVNVTTGERHTATTSSNGGFTIALPAGEYRLDIPLRAGEMLIKRPDVVNLDRGDIDSHVEFVMATPRVLRPRGPAYRVENGLGAPRA